jgi:heme-degrading monooxygenase HmoA
MLLTATTSRLLTKEQLQQVEDFLGKFLPRMKRQPGVIEILHYARLDQGQAITIVIWESEEDIRGYREGDLVKEAMAFEQSLGISTTREGPFPVQRLT